MAELNYTKQIEMDLMDILHELVKRILEIRERKEQPEFNKGLDSFCDYSEAIQKILNRTAAPDMHETLKALVEYYQRTKSAIPCLADAIKALAKAEGKA